MALFQVPELFGRILNGDRVAIGQAMTLVESDLEHDRKKAIELLELCFQKKSSLDTLTLTVSGAPGSGKSTLIDKLGLKAIADGKSVAVITIDPSSTISEGSILGDKARMQKLSSSSKAFVRSSPSGTLLGGIGRRTPELIFLLQSAGFNLILIETVGVGQSEHTAWQLTDGFMLVIQPGSGDELQGIKRGITELADVIIVNKSDGSMKEAAALTAAHYRNASHYLSPVREKWQTQVASCSALDGSGIDQLWQIIRLYWDSRLKDNLLAPGRERQKSFWLNWSLGLTAHRLLMEHPRVNQKITNGLIKMRENQSSVFAIEFEIERLMKALILDHYEDNHQA